MSAHQLSEEGTCQRCGFHVGRDPEQDCAPRAIYIPSRNAIEDFIAPNGITFYGRKTFEQVQAEHTDAIILPLDEAYARYQAGFRSPVREIDEAHFDRMLNVLPPARWEGFGESFESFHVSERLAANIVSWFIRYGLHRGASRYFTLDDDATLTVHELRTRVLAFVDAHPKD